MRLVFDIETNGLYEQADTVWCICAKDIKTGQKYEWTQASGDRLSYFLTSIMGEATELIGHNIINYDLPVLKKVLDWEPEENVKITDTLVMSRVLYPDRRKPANYSGKGGSHSLEAWGYRVGRGKIDNDVWTSYSPTILRRCREDVDINHLVYLSLQEEMTGHDWSEAIELEHDVARIITQQEINGVMFDKEYAQNISRELSLRIKKIDDHLLPNLPPIIKQKGPSVLKPFKTNGAHLKRVVDWCEDIGLDHHLIQGPFTRLELIPFNLGSIKQVKDYLLTQGWVPTQWNYSEDTGERTSPKLTEDSFESITGDMGVLIKERTLLSHRRAQIEGWIDRIRGDARITAGGNPCGTNTGRFRHWGVVNVPKAVTYPKEHPKKGQLVYADDPEFQSVPWGTEMRSMFTCSPGRVLVGHDASGLELRMLAHFMNDEDYINELLHGDIHSANQDAAGLPSRDTAKTFIYAFLYGAGDEKIGSIVDGDAGDGRELKRKFLAATPSLKRLITNVKRASGKGYLKGIDGRKIWMRRQTDGSVMTHKALNTLLQCSGSLVMKRSMILLDQSVKEQCLDVMKVIDMHDEAQADVLPSHAELYSQLAVQSIKDAGTHFNLKCPLDGEAKIGKNWAETH